MNKNFLYGVLGLVVVVLLGFWIFYPDQENQKTSNSDQTDNNQQAEWLTYENEKYGFTLNYPPSWQVKEFTDGLFPAINIYLPADNTELEQPLVHHDNATHVSVYPQGVPTEGILGENEFSSINWQIEIEEALDYVLDNGQSWATMVVPRFRPEGWNQSGFIYGQVELENLQTLCLQGGEEVEMENCSLPLPADAEIVRQADFDEENLKKVQEILQTFTWQNISTGEVSSFEACASLGNPVMESYPRKCSTPDGQVFVEEIGNEQELNDIIQLDEPRPNSAIESPLTISGQARGTWFFEASFPILLTDWDGLIIAEGYAETQDEWMTEDFVSFQANLSFDSPVFNQAPEDHFSRRGSLILQKANPSGLPANDQALEVPVRFSK